jgi:hypothetical protein
MGDLQKGERYVSRLWARCLLLNYVGDRYANMDYILLSAVLGITAMYLAISYDIACQWQINFEAWMAAMPECMCLDLTETKVVYGLPVWHVAAHKKKCQAQNSLSYLLGIG